MGFFDDEVENSLDEMFDFNHDDLIDPGERAMQLDFIFRDDTKSDEDYDDDDEEEYSFHSPVDDFLLQTGVTREEWSLMDEVQQKEVLEEAGIDPDELDDFDDF
ncbi:MAG: hypothetical protein K6G01_10780 [Eubacterium sp.]|nr:hypothetical protein [Eubacterium sp.]